MARGVPQVELEGLRLRVAKALQQLIRGCHVPVSPRGLEVVGMIAHAHGDHGVQGRILSEVDLLLICGLLISAATAWRAFFSLNTLSEVSKHR